MPLGTFGELVADALGLVATGIVNVEPAATHEGGCNGRMRQSFSGVGASLGSL